MMVREETACTCLSHVLLLLPPAPASCLLDSSWCPQCYLYIVSTHSQFQHCSRLLANCSQTISELGFYCIKTQHRPRQLGWALSDTQTENTFQPISNLNILIILSWDRELIQTPRYLIINGLGEERQESL